MYFIFWINRLNINISETLHFYGKNINDFFSSQVYTFPLSSYPLRSALLFSYSLLSSTTRSSPPCSHILIFPFLSSPLHSFRFSSAPFLFAPLLSSPIHSSPLCSTHLFSALQGRPYVWKRCILLIVSQLIDATEGFFLGSNERYILKLQNDTNFALVLWVTLVLGDIQVS